MSTMEHSPQQPEKSTDHASQSENMLEDLYDYNSMEGYDKPVRNARIMLFVIAALQIIPIFLAMDLPEPQNWITIGIHGAMGGIFAAMAFWTKRKPYTAIITALSVYTGIILLSAYLQPSSIAQGWLIKIGVYLFLFMALRNAKEVQEWLESKKRS